MIKRSRKPECPACKGRPYIPATQYQPAEECDTCAGMGQVSKRQAVVYRKRVEKRNRAPIMFLPAALRL